MSPTVPVNIEMVNCTLKKKKMINCKGLAMLKAYMAEYIYVSFNVTIFSLKWV